MVLGMAYGIFGIAFGEFCRRYRTLDMDGILEEYIRSSVALL